MEPQKNPKHNLEKKRFLYFQIGLVIVLGFVLVAFEWKTYETEPIDLGVVYANQLEEEIVPITIRAKTPPPPPLPKTDLSDKMKIVDNKEKTTKEFKAEEELPKVEREFPDQPEAPIDEPEFYYSVQKMPSFKGCEASATENEVQHCTNKEIINFINAHIKYPPKDRRAGREGMIYMRYVINSKGKVENIQINGMKEGSEEMIKEAKRVLGLLPIFNPGIQQGKAVPVQYSQNISFKLR